MSGAEVVGTVWDQLPASPAIDALAAGIKAGRTQHAWLLLGPRGAQKVPAARALAAAALCSELPGTGCGRCRSCRRVARGSHPDLHHVRPEGPLIPVDLIREGVVAEATRSPFESDLNVFIIEESDRMNEAAQNALLKTLEEPPADSIFILTADQEEELLITVRSRCRVVYLEPVSEETVSDILRGAGVGGDEAALASRIFEGDLRAALAFGRGESIAERRRAWASIPGRLESSASALDAAAEILDQVDVATREHAEAQKLEVTELAEALGEARGTATARNALLARHKRELRRVEEEVLSEAFLFLGGFYRDVFLIREGKTDRITNLDLVGELSDWARSAAAPVDLVRAMETCAQAAAAIPRNANRQLVVESALLQLVGLRRATVPT
ncbi:MAG TPA: DNA polymerase III subunit delta' [Actinomycetota bacterium]|nr:DNA polymerase III subunit delta' [Actinomycetota bacterium]